MSSRRFPTLLIAGLLLLQAVTVVAIVAVTSVNTRDALVEQLQGTLALVSTDTTARTDEFLVQAERAAQRDAELLSDPVLGEMDVPTLERYLRQQVRAQPDLAGAYVGFADGSFVYAGRDGAQVEGGTRSKVVRIDAAGREVVEVHRDADDLVVDEQVLAEDTYDPRVRPWYESAEVGRVSWTDPYVFFASRRPGVTASQPVVGPDGEVVGVVGVDLSLEQLSAFVGDLRITPNSRVVILDRSGELIAYGDVDKVVVEGGDGGADWRRARVDELDDPVLSAAYAAYEADPRAGADDATDGAPAQQAEFRGFDVDGAPWQAAVTPLPDRNDWLVAVAAPEDDFVGGIVDAERRNVAIAAGVGLLVVVAAIPLVRLLGRRMERVQRRADTDHLTGLPNRRRFNELLADVAGRPEQSSVAVIDVDEFKGVNDTYGHAVGDEALQSVAGRVRNAVRDTDLVARIGGDEFAAVLVGADVELAAEVMERARRALADEPTTTAGGPLAVTVTVGVAPIDGAGSLAAADAALYVAKAAGRNRVATPEGLHVPG